MRSRPAIPLLGLLGAALTLAAGCDRPAGAKIYPVEGVLTVNGEPAANASVAFHPRSGGSSICCPVGVTDANGRFRLSTQSQFDGAACGDYVVTIVWIDDSIEVDECVCPDPLMHDRLKGLYANADLSTVKVTVRPEANLFEIDAWRERTIEDLR